MSVNRNRSIIIWLLTGCILIYLMVVIGGITRLTHSGLSMVEWNLIVGSMPPLTDADWQVPFEKYKESPEYQQLNSHFTLEEFKSIYWWEYLHRFLGRLIGLVFVVPFLYFLIKKKLSPVLIRRGVILLLLGAFQGVLGWYMVKSGLSKNPYVSHYRLAAHLISAFTVFGFTLWYALDLIYPKQDETVDTSSLKKTGIVFFVFVIIQITYGAFVAGLKPVVGLGYPTFPKMGDEWFPDTITAFEPLWVNFLEKGAGVQFIHRYNAYIVVILILYIWYKSKQMKLLPLQTKSLDLLLWLVVFQFLLGVLTIMYSAPLLLGILHQTGAFFLFGASLFFIHQMGKKAKIE